MEHTKGPWRILHTGESWDPVGVFHPTKVGVAIAMLKGPPYCPMEGFVEKVEEQIANAKLIASAPELKATLEEMVKAAAEVKERYGKLDQDPFDPSLLMDAHKADGRLEEVTAKAQALLAKLK